MEAIKRILFVCTGNTCRSPMAEYILKDLIENSDQLEADNWEIKSAGISAVKGAEANDKAKSVMSELKIDLSDHNSVNIEDLELTKADLIITMTRKHSRALILRHPDLADKVFTLKEFSQTEMVEANDITDPFGLSEDVYRVTRDEIKENLSNLMEKLKSFDLKEED